jgi:hypothetical protein
MANIPDSVFQKHQHHDVYIDENPVSKKGKPVPGQLAALRCRTCNNWLKWLSGEELVALGRITAEELDEYREMKRQQNMEWDNSPWQ